MDVPRELLEEVLRGEEPDEAEEAQAETPSGPELHEVPEQEADPDVEERRAHAEPPPEDLSAVPEALDLVRIDNLLGVPLWYARDGNPRPHSFLVDRAFLPVVEMSLRQALRRRPRTPFGKLERIHSAGFFVGKDLFHGKGRACDWDRLVFEKLEIAPINRDHASPSLPVRQRYWAFAAICRSNTSYVLHGAYDGPHGDHIHQDNGAPVDFATRRSTVSLCQAVLNDIHGQSPNLVVDGLWGTKTETALRNGMERLRLGDDYTDREAWQRFLRRSCRLGFVLSVRE